MSMAAHPSKRFRSGEGLSVRTRGLALTEELHRVVRGCVSAATDRFQAQVRRLFVWVEDTNGPKGGAGMRCRVEVTLKRGGRFMATAVATNRTRQSATRPIGCGCGWFARLANGDDGDTRRRR